MPLANGGDGGNGCHTEPRGNGERKYSSPLLRFSVLNRFLRVLRYPRTACPASADAVPPEGGRTSGNANGGDGGNGFHTEQRRNGELKYSSPLLRFSVLNRFLRVLRYLPN